MKKIILILLTIFSSFFICFGQGGSNLKLKSSITTTPASPIPVGGSISVSVNIKNYGSSAFYGKLAAGLYQGSTWKYTIDDEPNITAGNCGGGNYNSGQFSIAAGNSTTYTFKCNSLPSSLVGTYSLYIRYQDGNSGGGSWTWLELDGGSYTNPITIVIGNTATSCDDPTGFTQTNTTQTSISLDWDNVSSADDYKLQYGESSSTSWSTAGSSINNSSYTINNLSCGTQYKFRVRANCGSDESDYSTLSNVSTLACGGGSPTCATQSDVIHKNNVTKNCGDALLYDVDFSNTSFRDAYTYNWSGPNGFSRNDRLGIVANNFINANAGTYSCVLSKSGCPNLNSSFSVSVGTPCGSAPTANFTATPTSGNAPLAVQFSNTSSGNPTNYSWNFGDGSPTTTTSSPNHTYSSPGSYSATLTASNTIGSSTKTATINVTPPAKIITLTSPSNNNTYNNIPQNITFSWSSSGFAAGTKYIVRVSDMVNGNPVTIINNQPSNGTTSLQYSTNLPLTSGHNYLWRVIGFEPGQTVPQPGQSVNFGTSSSTNSFSLQSSNPCSSVNDASGLPLLHYPLEGCKSDYDNGNVFYGFGSPWNYAANACGGSDNRKKHTGWDIRVSGDNSGSSGTGLIVNRKVYSVYSGVVKRVGNSSHGRYVTIEHNYNGTVFTSTYHHITEKSGLHNGSPVNIGEQIGVVANIPSNDHLHFGIRKAAYNYASSGITLSVSDRGSLPDEDQGNCKCTYFYSSNGNTYPMTSPYFPEKFIDPSVLSWLNNGCEANNGLISSLSPNGSVLPGASMCHLQNNTNYFLGNTDEEGVCIYKHLKNINIGDSLLIFSPDYENLKVEINQNILNAGKLKLPMIKKTNLSNKVMYPSVKPINNIGNIFNSKNINLKVKALNIIKYEVIQESALPETTYLDNESTMNLITYQNDTTFLIWDTLSNTSIHYLDNNPFTPYFNINTPLVSTYYPQDSLITITLQDTGINNLSFRFFSSVDTFVVNKRFIYYPNNVFSASTNLVTVVNNNSSSVKLWVDDVFYDEFTNSFNASVLKGTHKLTFCSFGYKDEINFVDSASNINLNLVPLSYSSVSDSSIFDFQQNGNIQYWKNITVKNQPLSFNNIISLKQYDDSFASLNLFPKSRKFIFRNLGASSSANIQTAITLDQIEHISNDSIYLLNIKNSNQFTKMPIDTVGICSYDSTTQRLDYYNINFNNGTVQTEELAIMKKLKPVIQNFSIINLPQLESISLPLSYFFQDPDLLPNDMSFQIIANPNFEVIMSSDSINITHITCNTGLLPFTIAATHDWLTVTLTFNINVVPDAPVHIGVISSPTTTICDGTNVTFTTNITSGGTYPTYQWKKNGTNISGATGSTYNSSTLANGDIVTCVLTSNAACPIGNPATSAPVTMTVNPLLPVSVNIVTDSSNIICDGTNVIFTATPTNGGTAPTYQWKKNGTNISGSTNSTYAISNLVNGDLITCEIISNALCPTGTPATSNPITMTVKPILPVSVSISANPSNTICTNMRVDFLASPVNGGINPTYQWKKNGTNINGASDSIYVSSVHTTGDVITCELTSSEICKSGSPALSNAITMTVNDYPLNAGAVMGATSICQGQTSVLYTVPAILNATSYVWEIPSGATGVSNSDNILINFGPNAVSGDIKVFGQNSCGTGANAILTVTVNPIPVLNVGNDTSICVGSSVNLNVLSGNSYTWSPSAGLSSSIIHNPVASPVQTTTYNVTATNVAGCTSTDNITINVFPIPQTPSIYINGFTLHSSSVNGNQWYNAYGAINSATDQTYTAGSAGEFYTIVTIDGCSSDKSNVINANIQTTGMSNTNTSENELSVVVAPNPFMDQVTFIINSKSDNTVNIYIMNTAGKKVREVESDKNIFSGNEERISVDFSDLPDGLYLGVLESEKEIKVIKMIKTYKQSRGNIKVETQDETDKVFEELSKKIKDEFYKKH